MYGHHLCPNKYGNSSLKQVNHSIKFLQFHSNNLPVIPKETANKPDQFFTDYVIHMCATMLLLPRLCWTRNGTLLEKNERSNEYNHVHTT